MNIRLLAWFGVCILALGEAGLTQAQRGSSKGSQGSGSSSRGSQSSPSPRPSSSAPRPSASAPAPRPSSSGSPSVSRPSSSPSRPTPSAQSPSRGSAPTGGSIRPSTTPSPRPSSAAPSSRPSVSGSSSAPTVERPSSRPTSSSGPSGAELYGGRTLTPAAPSSASPARPSAAPDAAPGSVTVPTSPTDSADSAPARPQGRPRFPAPYTPAGSAAGKPSRSVEASPLAPARGTVTNPGTPPGRGVAPEKGKGNGGPRVRYGEGPTRRFELTRGDVTPGAPSAPKPGAGKGGSGKSGSGSVAAPKPSKSVSYKELKREAPDKAKGAAVLARRIGRVSDVAAAAAFGGVGVVRPSGYHGGGLWLDDDHCDDPFGWSYPGYDCWSGWGFGWGYGYACYWGWYYPWWWYCSRPYYASYYSYWPVATVIYTEPEVIYVEREAQPAAEPVGEAVVGTPAQPAAAPAPEQAAQSPLSIAAQRYLELGDRAFREARYADAVQFYAKAVEFAPDQGALYLVLADALFAAGDYHYGAYAIRRALELDPTLVESGVDKHGFYPDPALFDAQLERLERFLAEHPTDRDARLMLALNYLFGGKPREAARTIDSAVTAMADDPAAQRILARAHSVAGGG